MIPHGVEIFVGLDPIDLRWSFDRLAGVVTERIGREARCGALFAFFGKRRDAIKVLFCDGTGQAERTAIEPLVEHAHPEVAVGTTSVAIEERVLDDLLDGIDVESKAKRASSVQTSLDRRTDVKSYSRTRLRT